MTSAAHPQLSVVIPTRNRPLLLSRALSSVLQQEFDQYELLVVDDASSAATHQLVQAYNDPKVRYIRKTTQQGAGAARNTGILHAEADWVAFLDDDDELLPGFLSAMSSAVKNAPKTVGLLWCGVRWVDYGDAGTSIRDEIWQPHFASREAAYRSFLRRRQVGTNCGLTLRRRAVDRIGLFDENLRCAEDTDLLIRMVREYDFAVVPQILVKIHRHSGSRLTSYGTNMAQAYEWIIAKHEDTLAQDPSLASHLHYKAGWLYYQGRDRLNARKHMWRSLRCNPRHAKAWFAVALYETMGEAAPSIHGRLSAIGRG